MEYFKYEFHESDDFFSHVNSSFFELNHQFGNTLYNERLRIIWRICSRARNADIERKSGISGLGNDVFWRFKAYA